MKKLAVVLLNMGGPDSLEAIQPFLYNLFSDPDIFKIPVAQKFFARVISKKRAPKVAEDYKLMGGKSPLNEWTELQRKGLEERLRERGLQADVITAMRYWHPLTSEAAAKVEAGSYDYVLLLPLYPHYSIVTTGSSFNDWDREYIGTVPVVESIRDYHDHPSYIKALNGRITEAAQKLPKELRDTVHLLFSAHSTPQYLKKQGDPYQAQIEKTVAEVMKLRPEGQPHSIAYQSKVGPVKWLEPPTDGEIKRLAAKGVKHMMVIPVSFVSDHIETLVELGEEYRETAEKAGVENYIVMHGFNDFQPFINALETIAMERITAFLNGKQYNA